MNTASSISRRAFVGATAAATLGGSVVRAAAPPPNVVLLITDDQGYGDLGCHGNPILRTPHLDRLHAQSVRFTNFHASPTCAPTRASLLTGRYSNATGVWHTIMGRSLLAHDEVTMADCFRASGYRTGIFGKWHLGDNYPCRPQDRGFDESLVCGGGGVWQTPDYFGNDYHDDTFLRNGRPEACRGFCTNVWFDNAMRFMDESVRQRKPFFCYLSTNAPHSPMWAPEAYSARHKERREPGFFGMIENLDDNVGRLMEVLRDRKLESNTLFLFMTDNGTSSGATVFNAGMRGQKGSAYDGGHRVPLFVRWPGGALGAPRDVTALTAHIDVLPTLIQMCGLKRPTGPAMAGRSLLPLLREERARWDDRAIVVDSQRLENLVKWRQTAVMTDRWRLVNPSPDGRADALELFDMQADPGQRRNVAAEHADVAARLAREYDTWWEASSQRAGEYVRIVLGSARANPVRLTCHDWHGEGGAELTWNQAAIRRAPAANGFWTVDVERAGLYRIELRRWPKEVDLPVNAAYADAAPNRELTPGVAISAVRARVRIGTVEQERPVEAADRAAVFNVRLTKGPVELQTWFLGADGAERGAYFAYVERTGA